MTSLFLRSALITVLAGPTAAWAGATTCLTGTDPGVANDAAQIAAVRDLVDAACPCANFDGTTTGQKHGDYIKCAKPIIAAQVDASALRKQCGSAVKKMVSASTCGVNPALNARPCISTSLTNGKIACKVRASTKTDGSPNDKCVSSAKATAAACPAFTHCLDAADTNDDLRIAAPGDNGQCVSTGIVETVCQTLTPPMSGNCTVTPGTSGTILVGDVLAPGVIYRGGQVVVDATGTIIQVGCAADCAANGTCAGVAATATTVTCPEGAISPGLINTHDHITFTHNSPYTDTGERYEHRHDWRVGLHGHTEIPTVSGATADQIRYGELRHLMGGATSLVGSGGQAGLVRNLDNLANQGGLAQDPVSNDTFPLGDSAGEQLDGTCSYPSPVTPAEISGDESYVPHVAEGIDGYAQNEAICLGAVNPTNDVTLDQTAFTHGLGLSAWEYAAMAANGTGLIWSPRSNITLYGNTTMVTAASRLGVTIAIGTDWMPTGSMNLLRELSCADSFNQTYLDGFFSDADLWQMVTANAAELTATGDVIGALSPGLVADISIFSQATLDAHRAVIGAQPADVLLVMRGGQALYGDADVLAEIPGLSACDNLDVCGTNKSVCLTSEIGTSLATLQTNVGAIYPSFFCGVPTDEPSCLPLRSASVNASTIYDGTSTMADPDGDGVEGSDNCPSVFNPIRPLDNGVQADSDADGEGDACDVCPLDADMTDCAALVADDLDGDGVVVTADNCPTAANADQADLDADLKGDACDECPNDPNPGATPCP